MAVGQNQNAMTGVIVLAAGASSRLGRPKQLLAFDGKTLLQHALQTAKASSLHPVVLILGAAAETIQNDISDQEIHVTVNEAWQEGMASSIRCGLSAIKKISSAIEGVILMVCDQPFVSGSLLNELVATHQKTGSRVVASSYGETFGPPVFFHQSLFDELLQLTGDVGARSIVKQHANEVEIVPFPKGVFDVDTEAEYARLKMEGGHGKEQP